MNTKKPLQDDNVSESDGFKRWYMDKMSVTYDEAAPPPPAPAQPIKSQDNGVRAIKNPTRALFIRMTD